MCKAEVVEERAWQAGLAYLGSWHATHVCVLQYDEEDEDGTPMAPEEGEHNIDPFSNRSFLANPNERGIKRVGIIYSPRKSWWIGVMLVALSAAILVVTLVTAVL